MTNSMNLKRVEPQSMITTPLGSDISLFSAISVVLFGGRKPGEKTSIICSLSSVLLIGKASMKLTIFEIVLLSQCFVNTLSGAVFACYVLSVYTAVELFI